MSSAFKRLKDGSSVNAFWSQFGMSVGALCMEIMVARVAQLVNLEVCRSLEEQRLVSGVRRR